jgi:hypothetical protein
LKKKSQKEEKCQSLAMTLKKVICVLLLLLHNLHFSTFMENGEKQLIISKKHPKTSSNIQALLEFYDLRYIKN